MQKKEAAFRKFLALWMDVCYNEEGYRTFEFVEKEVMDMANRLPEDMEKNGKTMMFDAQQAEDGERTDLTRSSLYPVRGKLPVFLKNPVVWFSAILLVLIVLVFGLLYGLGGTETPDDTTDNPDMTEPDQPDKAPAAWRVGGLLDVEMVAKRDLHSGYALLVDLDTMKAVAGKNIHEKMYPASMTKIMTFIVAYENISDLSVLLELTPEIRAQYPEAFRVCIDVGDFMTAEQCLYAMIMESDADAVLMLVEQVAGSEAAFVTLMNEKAQQMGLVDTHFENATGLHHDDHYTTACEMAEILAYAMQYPLFYDTACTYSYRTPLKYYKDGVLTDYPMTFYNSTLRKRLENNGISAKLSGGGEILGGKTGLTDEARWCQAAIAKDSDGSLYIAIFGSAASAEKSAKDTRWLFNTYLD